jgi:hypothetical protein
MITQLPAIPRYALASFLNIIREVIVVVRSEAVNISLEFTLQRVPEAR